MNQSELLNKLREQMQLIEFCLSKHDSLELIAISIATHIRVLVHDTKNSTSLLQMLGLKYNINYYDTSMPMGSISYWKGNFSIEGWDLSKLPHIGIVGKEINIKSRSECEIKYTPIFKDWCVKDSKKNFEVWWNTIIFDNNAGYTLTRQQLILDAVNKDGGAHIDDTPRRYKSLSKVDVLPFSINGIPKAANNIPVYSCISQIGWELLESIKDANILSSNTSHIL